MKLSPMAKMTAAMAILNSGYWNNWPGPRRKTHRQDCQQHEDADHTDRVPEIDAKIFQRLWPACSIKSKYLESNHRKTQHHIED